jgi:hypothetical protein
MGRLALKEGQTLRPVGGRFLMCENNLLSTDITVYQVGARELKVLVGGGKCVVVSPDHVVHRAGEVVEDRIMRVGAIAGEGVGMGGSEVAGLDRRMPALDGRDGPPHERQNQQDQHQDRDGEEQSR